MRTRNHEIKLRLNDRELARLNDMVERSIFNREEFLRMMLAGFSICEAPTEYRAFRYELIRRMDEIRMLLQTTRMTDADRAGLHALLRETGAVIRRMDEAYVPYYKRTGHGTERERQGKNTHISVFPARKKM